MRSALPALTLVACALLPQAALAGARFRGARLPLRLPEQTYRLIEHNFSTLYQQTDFTPQITNSYFNHSDLYRFAGIPLAITPQNGFQMEVFGQLYNKSSQIYAQMSPRISPLSHPAGGHDGDQATDRHRHGAQHPLTTRLTVKALASSNGDPGLWLRQLRHRDGVALLETISPRKKAPRGSLCSATPSGVADHRPCPLAAPGCSQGVSSQKSVPPAPAGTPGVLPS